MVIVDENHSPAAAELARDEIKRLETQAPSLEIATVVFGEVVTQVLPFVESSTAMQSLAALWNDGEPDASALSNAAVGVERALDLLKGSEFAGAEQLLLVSDVLVDVDDEVLGSQYEQWLQQVLMPDLKARGVALLSYNNLLSFDAVKLSVNDNVESDVAKVPEVNTEPVAAVVHSTDPVNDDGSAFSPGVWGLLLVGTLGLGGIAVLVLRHRSKPAEPVSVDDDPVTVEAVAEPVVATSDAFDDEKTLVRSLGDTVEMESPVQDDDKTMVRPVVNEAAVDEGCEPTEEITAVTERELPEVPQGDDDDATQIRPRDA